MECSCTRLLLRRKTCIAKCHENLNQPDKAIAAYQPYLTDYPNDSKDRIHRATTCITFLNQQQQAAQPITPS